MNVQRHLFVAFGLFLFAACNNTPTQKNAAVDTATTATQNTAIETVFSDSVYQLTGVAVAKNNRLFVNYPYWLDIHANSVVEVKDGKAVPYPDAEWNSFKKGEDGQNKFVCVQAVVTDDKGFLWVVDAAGIGLGKVYQHANKVVKINLATNKVEKIYRFPANVAGESVYLNDIRIDNEKGFAYISNSSTGGIVVLNINTGNSKIFLATSPAVKSDTNYHFSPLGEELLKPDGKPVKINSDGIALSPDRKYVYFKPLTDNRLYRIATEILQDFKTSDEVANKAVEDLGKFTTTDGMIFDKKGNLYLGDIEHSAIIKVTPNLKVDTLVKDPESLIWPDSYSISDDGYLYISNSQIHLSPRFHGKDLFKRPFTIVRIKI